jgi:hypothetical protein
MRPRSPRALALLLAAGLALPSAGLAQATAPREGVAGSWEGWATLVNDWPGPPCRYDGGKDVVSVRLELAADSGALRGSVAIDLPAETGSSCPPLRKRYQVAEVAQGPGTVSFEDSGGNEWTLAVRRGGEVLQGLLAWRPGGPEQPLAEGFTRPDGQRPAARLSGEVRLRRGGPDDVAQGPGATGGAQGPGATGGAEAAAAGSAPAAGGGRHASNLAKVLGANVVALGLLYGANKLGQGSSETGTVTCSPRTCIVGAPSEPCFCEGNVLSGASCGTTTWGAPLGAPCDGRSVPCQSGLSCNSGLCEDQFGRCPY